MKFTDLKLQPSLLKAIGEVGYETPTPIQQQAIPPVLDGRDLLGCAQTGTGKTAAFALPMLQRLNGDASHNIRALVLTPTRELALQIYENVCLYARYTPVSAAVIFGGVSQVPQVETIKRGVDFLIATPGRLWDLMGQKIISLDHVEIFVLDEADRMLDMGFIHDVRRIVECLPKKRQTLLFSATMPDEIVHLADGMLDRPVRVSISPTATPVERINQQVIFIEKPAKRELLEILLRQKGIPQTLVFTRTKHGADRVARDLNRAGITARSLHGDKSQGARQAALHDFKENKIAVLVATDIAARGLDISELPLVINFEIPNIPDTYVHRIGRTGRAGQKGTAISFCDSVEREYLKDIEKLMRCSVPVMELSEEIHSKLAEHEAEKRVAVQSVKRAPQPRSTTKQAPQPSNPQKQAPQQSAPRRRLANHTDDAPAKPKKRLAPAAVKRESNIAEPKPVVRQAERQKAKRAPSAGARRGGTRRPRREQDDNSRVDIATPVNTGRISDETAARIRAKVEAKLAERAIAKDKENAPARRPRRRRIEK